MFAHSLFYLTHRTKSGATSPGQSGPGGYGNEVVRYNLQISKASASPSDIFMSYLEYSLGRGFNSSTEIQALSPTTSLDWATMYLLSFIFLPISLSLSLSLDIYIYIYMNCDSKDNDACHSSVSRQCLYQRIGKKLTAENRYWIWVYAVLT